MASQPLSASGSAGIGVRAALRSRSRLARSARAIARWSVAAAGATLAVFHLYLFWDRLAGGDLLDPAVAGRWLAAAALVAGLAALRRIGVPLARGRNAVVVWALVVLLHAWGRALPALSSDAPPIADAGLIFVLPSTLGVVGLGLLCVTAARRRPLAFRATGRLVAVETSGRLSDGWRRGGTTRGPPLAAF
jgi:hypothetical protein